MDDNALGYILELEAGRLNYVSTPEQERFDFFDASEDMSTVQKLYEAGFHGRLHTSKGNLRLRSFTEDSIDRFFEESSHPNTK